MLGRFVRRAGETKWAILSQARLRVLTLVDASQEQIGSQLYRPRSAREGSLHRYTHCGVEDQAVSLSTLKSESHMHASCVFRQLEIRCTCIHHECTASPQRPHSRLMLNRLRHIETSSARVRHYVLGISRRNSHPRSDDNGLGSTGADFVLKPGTRSRRIADQIRLEISPLKCL